MMFAFEILLTGVVFTEFIPLVVAAVCGSLVSRIILNEDVLFQFHTRELFNYMNIPFYIVLGLACGFYARYFVLVSRSVEHFFKKLPLSGIRKAMLGGAMLSVLCVLFPPLFGEGYDTVKSLSSGQIQGIIENSFFKYFGDHRWLPVLFLGLVCLLKAFATSITIFSGGNGGNFAPSLFAGGTLGYFFAIICVQLGISNVPVANLVIVGMAGVMSGVLYAPLTAIFLIAESSSGYDLFIPLMIVAVISYLMAKWFSPISPDIKQLADEGKVFTQKHDKNLLSMLHISKLIEKNVQFITIDASFTDLLELVKTGKRNFIAVTDEDHHLVGIITLDDIRPVMFNTELYASLHIIQLMKSPQAVIHVNEDVGSIIKKFDETNSWNLPVIDDEEKFMGFVSKSSILNQYRQILVEYS
jgi:CIC family chloride channel protein